MLRCIREMNRARESDELLPTDYLIMHVFDAVGWIGSDIWN